MKLPPETIAGARKMIAYWRRAFSGSVEATPSSGGTPSGPRRDLIADMRALKALRRFERDDFGPLQPEPLASPPASSDRDHLTNHERGQRLRHMIALFWEAHATWHAPPEGEAATSDAGEEAGPGPEIEPDDEAPARA